MSGFGSSSSSVVSNANTVKQQPGEPGQLSLGSEYERSSGAGDPNPLLGKKPDVKPSNIPVDGDTESALPPASKAVRKLFRRLPRDPRLIKYDLVGGRNRLGVGFSVPRFDRMSAEDAGELLHGLHCKFGIQNCTEEVLWAFDKALFFNHTINGASPVQPGEKDMVIDDPNSGQISIPMREIIDELGFNARRFFRAFADLVTEANREVIEERDPEDQNSIDRYDQLMQVAFQRGMVRYPELCHDSADACTRLTLEERATVLASKTKVLANSSKTAQETNPYYKVET